MTSKPKLRIVESLTGHRGLTEDAKPKDFGAAMMRCQGYAPACSDNQECGFGGFCHQPRGEAYKTVHDRLKFMQAAMPRGLWQWNWMQKAIDAIEREANWQRNAIWRAVVKRHRLQARLKENMARPCPAP